MDETQTRRREALVALAAEYWLDVDDIIATGVDPKGHFDKTCDEDLFPFVAPEGHWPELPETICEYAVVTKHDDHRYVIPIFDTLASAFARAAQYVDDDIFTEYPIEVVNLDDGTRWKPRRASFDWEQQFSFDGSKAS